MLVLTLSSNVVFSADAIVHTAPEHEIIEATDTPFLINIFTRKTTRWISNGDKIVVFIRPINSIEHKTFVLDWLGVTNYRFKKLLKQNTFSGRASSVKIIKTDEQMMFIINNTPNSIGYVGDHMVYNNDSNIINIIIIN